MKREKLSIIDNLVKNMTAAEIRANLDEEGKKYRAGTKNSLVWYTFAGWRTQITSQLLQISMPC